MDANVIDEVRSCAPPLPAAVRANAAHGLIQPPRRPTWRGVVARWGVGLSLCALHGAALGARHGVGSLLLQAVGVSLGFAAVALLAAPAFYILLAHQGHPIGPLGLASALSRSTATTGVVLAGLAPATLLVTTSTEGLETAALHGVVTLGFASLIGLRRLSSDLQSALERAHPEARRAGRVVATAFLCFSAALALRVWWLTVPSLGGGA